MIALSSSAILNQSASVLSAMRLISHHGLCFSLYAVSLRKQIVFKNSPVTSTRRFFFLGKSVKNWILDSPVVAGPSISLFSHFRQNINTATCTCLPRMLSFGKCEQGHKHSVYVQIYLKYEANSFSQLLLRPLFPYVHMQSLPRLTTHFFSFAPLPSCGPRPQPLGQDLE